MTKEGHEKQNFWKAARKGQADKVAAILKEARKRGDDAVSGLIEFVDSAEGRNALMVACQGGHDQAVSEIIEAGCKVNETDKGKYRNSPLHYAAMHSKASTVDLLLKKGADPYKENLLGQIPLDVARMRGQMATYNRLERESMVAEKWVQYKSHKKGVALLWRRRWVVFVQTTKEGRIAMVIYKKGKPSTILTMRDSTHVLPKGEKKGVHYFSVTASKQDCHDKFFSNTMLPMPTTSNFGAESLEDLEEIQNLVKKYHAKGEAPTEEPEEFIDSPDLRDSDAVGSLTPNPHGGMTTPEAGAVTTPEVAAVSTPVATEEEPSKAKAVDPQESKENGDQMVTAVAHPVQ